MESEHRPDTQLPSGEPDKLAELLRAVGRRPEPPAEDRVRVFVASHAAWRQTVMARRRQRWSFALAAVVAVVAIGVVSLLPRDGIAPDKVAELVRSIGGVEIFDEQARRWIVLRDGRTELVAGDRLRTDANGGLALRVNDAASFRVAATSELRLTSRGQIELLRGAVYAQNRGRDQLAVVTAFGRVVDIGTQFEVRVSAEALQTRVRSGAVRLVRSEQLSPLVCDAGQQLRVDSAGRIAISPFAPDDAYWDWTARLARAPAIEGLQLENFLVWVAEELGRSLRYANPNTAALARSVRLHGDVSTLTPLQALDTVLIGTSLWYALPDDGTILVMQRETLE
jgi:hypothetical protein